MVRKITMVAVLLLTVSQFAWTADSVKKRLDLFDAQGNHLMFVVFENDQNGNNIGRTVYMSDSTFVRSVGITRNAQGERTKETSLNYNGDTVLTSTYAKSGESTTLTVRNQFGLDQFGVPVTYRASGADEYAISQRGAAINTMRYEYDGQGNPTKISVLDPAGTQLYYGTFSDVGILAPRYNAQRSVPQVSMRGNGVLSVRFALARPARVRCELVTLHGRRAGELFSGMFSKGAHQKQVRLTSLSSKRTADGMYVVVLTIDGVVVSRSRQLIAGSGRRAS